MKKFLTLLLLLTYGISSGQNLIPNGDFEQYWHCPHGLSLIDSSKFWFQTANGSSDYYNQCAAIIQQVNVPNIWIGFQQAHSGVAFAGICLWYQVGSNYRELIEVPLSSTGDTALIAGYCYHFQMYINLGNDCSHSSDNIGVYFSDTAITAFLALPIIPQINNTLGNFPDSLNWALVSGNYTAHGGESYLTIGNFNLDANTNLVLVNPSATNPASYVYIDDVSLTVCDNNGITNYNNIEINIFPNPVTEQFIVNIDKNEPSEIILYDLISRVILKQGFTNTTTINTEQLSKGMYLYAVQNRNGIIRTGKIIKQ